MSGRRAAGSIISCVGKVTLDAVRQANGDDWVGAIHTAYTHVQSSYPEVNAIQIHGARAHQSHTVKSHTNVISAAFFQGGVRVVSGHIHKDGTVDLSKKKDKSGGSSSKSGGSSSRSGGSSSQTKKKSSKASFATGMTWQTGSNGIAEWWDGKKWKQGEWSDEHQKWIAYYNGEWYAWE